MTRKVVDCRDFPSETNCTLTISGREMEVLQAASEHAVSTHGHVDGPELRKQIHAMMKDEVSASARFTGSPSAPDHGLRRSGLSGRGGRADEAVARRIGIVTGRDDDFLARTEPFAEPHGGGVEHSSSGYAEGLRHGRAERRSWRNNERRAAVHTAFVVGAGVMGAAVVAAAAFTVLVFAGLYAVSPGVSRDHRAATLEQQSPSTTTPPSSASDAADPSSASDATDPSSPSTAAETGRSPLPSSHRVATPPPSNSSGLEQLSSASLTAPSVAPAPAPTTAPSESPTCQGDREKSPLGRGGQRSKCSRS